MSRGRVKRNDVPIAFAAALLLGVLRVLAGVAGFGEVAREVLLRSGGTVGEALVVAVVGLVRAGHCCGMVVRLGEAL